MKFPQFPKLQSNLTTRDKVALGLRFTAVAIIAYILGTLVHSEIWHFFLGD